MTRVILALFLSGSLLVAQAQEQKPAAQPATPPAAEAAKPEPGPGQDPDPAIIEGIMTCLANGLPPEWRKAWFTIKQVDRNETGNARAFEANFFYAVQENDAKGRRLKPCGGGEDVIDGVGSLNAYLPENQKQWTGATFTFFRDGRYHAAYDYTPFKPKPEPKKAAAKPAAKKKQEAAK